MLSADFFKVIKCQAVFDPDQDGHSIPKGCQQTKGVFTTEEGGSGWGIMISE